MITIQHFRSRNGIKSSEKDNDDDVPEVVVQRKKYSKTKDLKVGSVECEDGNRYYVIFENPTMLGFPHRLLSYHVDISSEACTSLTNLLTYFEAFGAL